MNKVIKAVSPYIYLGQLNFKNKPYEAWIKTHGSWFTVNGWYPKWLHGLWFRYDLFPTLWQCKKEVRLVFVQPVSLYFDAGFSVLTHEVIPMIWDCWEQYDAKVVRWMKRHRVRRAIFTSGISAKRIKALLPDLDVLVITEGIDTENYPAGKKLKDRSLDVFNYGRMPKWVNEDKLLGNIGNVRISDSEFFECLQNAKITVAVPRSDVDSSCHETLTQRYWEAMLSRIVMVGRAPKELIDLIGYDPVVELKEFTKQQDPCLRNEADASTKRQQAAYVNTPVIQQINEILLHIEDYQELVNRNRETALKFGNWESRVEKIKEWCQE